MKPMLAVPATLALCYRAYSHKSLTPLGIFTAALTAAAHAVHPWNLPFVLLVVFFLAGTRVTKVKKEVKERLTIHARGGSGAHGGEGPRTHVQVLANSAVASLLSLLHAYQIYNRPAAEKTAGDSCFEYGSDIAVIGIIANYAAVAADTFSSELGILSTHQPRLITSPTLRKVPKGTNGGVTLWGLFAGLIGSGIVVAAAMVFLPFCPSGWDVQKKLTLAGGLTIIGFLGSVLDSVLGGLFQATVKDTRTGRVVEGHGGKRVLLSKPGPNSKQFKKAAGVKSKVLRHEGKDAIAKPVPTDEQDKPARVVESGWGLLDNNDVNFLMAAIMSIAAMVGAGWYYDVPLANLLEL